MYLAIFVVYYSVTMRFYGSCVFTFLHYHLYRFIYPQNRYHDNILCGMTTWSAAVFMNKVVRLNWKYSFIICKLGWCIFPLYSLVGLPKLLHNISTTYSNLICIRQHDDLFMTPSDLLETHCNCKTSFDWLLWKDILTVFVSSNLSLNEEYRDYLLLITCNQ